MDIFPFAAFGIVATFMALSCLVLCTCAYLKAHVYSGGRGSDGDLPVWIPRSESGEQDNGRRGSFGFGSSIGGGGPISSVSPNGSTSSSSKLSGSGDSGFRNSILEGQQNGDDPKGNETSCDGELGGNGNDGCCDMGCSSGDGGNGGDGGAGGGDCGE